METQLSTSCACSSIHSHVRTQAGSTTKHFEVWGVCRIRLLKGGRSGFIISLYPHLAVHVLVLEGAEGGGKVAQHTLTHCHPS